ncbi:MAG: hypothetical protein KC502_11515 [Myxococcales bacterium]|nr:hypothetical protein [Myxococcales bacterium]
MTTSSLAALREAHPLPAQHSLLMWRAAAVLTDCFDEVDAHWICWGAALLARTDIGVVRLTSHLGVSLSAQARMASRQIFGDASSVKTPQVFWRVAARGTVAVRAAALCTLLARLEAARLTGDRSVRAALVEEAQMFALPQTSGLESVRHAFELELSR